MEVFYAEQWGFICSYDWDINDTMVVCRQLGFSYSVRAFAERGSYEFRGIWLDEFNCTGNEENLTSCSHRVPPSDYECRNGWFSWAAVECSSTGKTLICLLCVCNSCGTGLNTLPNLLLCHISPPKLT